LTAVSSNADAAESQSTERASARSATPLNESNTSMPVTASGEKAKAGEILAAIRLVNQLDEKQRPATDEERNTLAKFGGFGAVALRLFPDPITGKFKDEGWQQLGGELQSLLSQEDYYSAKRTTFNAFYTSPIVMQAMHNALDRLGVPDNALVLEPGCGIGNFMGHATAGRRFIGVELDRTSGRIARALYPQHDIRIENFRDTMLPEGKLDAVIGNVPFANVSMKYNGEKFSLHDYFFAKSVDALKPGGVQALVTSHFTLDKQNAGIREYLGERADFLGAIRLPSDAFKREGTAVVTDILFLRKRAVGEPAQHVDADWLTTAPLTIEGTESPVNRYFHNHPEMVLGDWSREKQLYGGNHNYSLRSNGDLAQQLQAAVANLPQAEPKKLRPAEEERVVARFARPPPLKHLTEGSFFIDDDRTIRQITDGEATPATHGNRELRTDGTMMGQRLAALVDLRDGARRVLQSQNEDWPETERDDVRRSLNRTYDRFTAKYGPVNRTTFSETKTGTKTRRMPNLVKFREDPDAMLVMSLEDYDEVTGKATKAAILQRDVVGKKPPVTEVTSAEEGLLVSLDHRGRVDLPYIADLYRHSEERVIEELGDLIYQDPQTNSWETADVYLSGNVRTKLAAAVQAGEAFVRNAERLREVQPPDVLPGDIDANLGAPWIPASDLQAFAAELFRVSPEAITVGQLKREAVWSVDGDYSAQNSVAATSEFGTNRAGGIRLFEQALNMQTPVIYDTIHLPDRDERVLNQEETLAAREKQKQIKDRFRSWVFDDPDRAERLVRLYNDTYNSLRPRLFDGAHLQFPGMNQAIELRPHQQDAVWRTMSSGNTLLAHVVGSGKTFTMAAAGMKLKETGLAHKPMFVVPNHMLEQFSREFLQLYPNAKLLVTSKDDMSRDRRKRLTAKIASGEWDGIVVTHSSFERIGMSADWQERFLREQISEYDTLLQETAAEDTEGRHRNIIKSIEKQKAAREEKLNDLLAREKKDDGLVFDELGVDHVFIDEAQYFKNLELQTKMNRVAGIQTGGSQRSFDLYTKARFLDERHPGHGVTFATGTPISNTMVEMFTMQKFLDPKGLADRGIDHFDAWAATFGEVVDTMEISPDGSTLKARSRFARFNNLPELQQMFRSFADVQTAEMLDLPRPELEGGKPHVVACPMSDEQCEMQQKLVDRYERIRSSKIDPREDNALAITTDGRKLALDGRVLDPNAGDHPESKVNTMVDRIAEIWKSTTALRGTQMVFSDLGVKPTPWGYSAYDDVIDKLTERGIPRDEIASIGDAASDAKKQALFGKVRNGSVRVLLGSTQKMGTGTNVQKRLAALHHLDAPWKPAEVEQREGRILRQGNDNKEVSIHRYVTEGSFDAFMWQALETKARFISQIMTGSTSVRRAEDIGGQELSFAEVKAIASGNPAMLTLAEADGELQRLTVLRKNHTDEQFLAQRKLRELPDIIERLSQRAENLQTDQQTLKSHAGDRLKIDDRTYPSDDLMDVLGGRLKRLLGTASGTKSHPLGSYHGLTFGVSIDSWSRMDVYLEGATTRSTRLAKSSTGPRAVMNALDRLADGYTEEIDKTERDVTLAREQLGDYRERIGKPFEHEAAFRKLTNLRNQLNTALSQSFESGEESPASSGELAEEIKQLLAAQETESALRPSREQQTFTAEQPIAARLRQHIAKPQADKVSESIHTSDSQSDISQPAALPTAVPSEQTTAAKITPQPSGFRDRVAAGPPRASQLKLF